MREILGFEPRYTTAEAFADVAAGLPPTGGRTERALSAVAERLPSTRAAAAEGRARTGPRAVSDPAATRSRGDAHG